MGDPYPLVISHPFGSGAEGVGAGDAQLPARVSLPEDGFDRSAKVRLAAAGGVQEDGEHRRIGKGGGLAVQAVAVRVGQGAAPAPGLVRPGLVAWFLSSKVRPVERLKQLAPQPGEVAPGQHGQTPAKRQPGSPVFGDQVQLGGDSLAQRRRLH